MSNKIPCGGFYLDDMLNVNDSGELSINGGTPYQQLVTGGEGKVKWEDRLAYDDSKLVVDFGEGKQFVKVSDEVPSWASVDSPLKTWISSGANATLGPEEYDDLSKGSFVAGASVAFITTDNVEFRDIVFPKKGLYFVSIPNLFYTTGIASADSDTPEITWDGNIGVIKKLDKKYIPSELNEVILPSSTSGSTKKFRITVDDSGTISATQMT